MLDIALNTFLSILCVLIALVLYKSKGRRGPKFPPSPPYALPIVGHFHLLKPPMHRVFHFYSQRYGPIISFRLGSRRIVVVSSLSGIEECFIKNDVVLANRPKLLMGKHVSYNYTTVSQAPYGDHWRNLRRLGATEIFSNYRVNMLTNIRKDEINQLIIKLCHQSPQGFNKVELKSKFHELSFNIMMRMATGERYYGDKVTNKEKTKQFRDILNDISTYIVATNPGDFLPLLNWINGGRFERTVKGIASRADEFLQVLVDDHRQKKDDIESNNTVINHLLSMQEMEPEYYTDEIIKGFILVILFAGSETSSVTLEWAMANLLNNPEMLKKVKDELDSQVGEERLVEEADLSKLQYLQNVILETLRLYPAAPLLDPHMASEDCMIGGYDVPRDTIVLANIWALQRDPTLWDDPTSFKPERFDKEERESHKLIPFGLGRRSCPGMSIEQRVLGLTLGSLIQCLDWKWVSEEEIDMTEAGGITMPKLIPLEALCRQRELINKILS